MHYHDKLYECDNDYGLPAQVMRLVHTYSVSTTEVSFNPADYNEAQHTISPFIPDDLPFCEGVCQHLTFD